MNTLKTAKTVLGAVLISGAAVAQNCPGPQCYRAPGKQPQMWRSQRGPQGGPGGRWGQRGPQMGMRGQRGGPQGMQRGGPQMGQRPSISPERLKQAGATDEQLESLKKIHEEQQLKQVDLKAKAEKAQIKLKQLISSENASEKDVLKAVDAVTEAKAAIMKQGISARFKAREILGDEVSKKLREMGPPKGKGPGGQRGPGAQRPQGPHGRGGPGGPPKGENA